MNHLKGLKDRKVLTEKLIAEELEKLKEKCYFGYDA